MVHGSTSTVPSGQTWPRDRALVETERETESEDLLQVETMLKQMDDIFIKSLLSVQKIMINDKHCFELYGYDILLDDNLKPWLIETNASPSLTASNHEDNELKNRLLDDMINVIDMEGRLNGKEKRVGGFDLIYNDTPVYVDETPLESFNLNSLRLNSFLGQTLHLLIFPLNLLRCSQAVPMIEQFNFDISTDRIN